MDKNNIIFAIYACIFIGLITYIYHVENNKKSKNNILIKNNNNDSNDVFNNLNYKINNNNFIINRSNDIEFNHILHKTKRKLQEYHPNIVLITSKIIVSTNVFSYISTRSIYTTETRFKQTIETIESIRKNIPNACIFLIDDSNFETNFVYMHTKLHELCDVFINPLHDKDLHYYTNVNKYKSIAEGYQIIYFLDIFTQLNIKFDRFFKISGRYYINKTFNFNNYINDDMIFSLYEDKVYYTCFYMISHNKFNLYRNAYNVFYLNKNDDIFVELSVEISLPYLLKYNNIKLIKNLGITKRLSINDNINDI